MYVHRIKRMHSLNKCDKKSENKTREKSEADQRTEQNCC